MEDENEGNGIGQAVLAAAIAAGAGLLSNWWTNRQNKKNWEKQNEYNAPEAQMARYRAAGLNPNLIYSSGSASAGNAASLPPYQTQHITTQDVLNAAQAVQNLRTMSANIRKANSEAQAASASARGQELANYRSEVENHYLDSYLAQRNATQALNMQYLTGQISLQQYQKRVLTNQAEQLLQNALYSKFKRTEYDPGLLSVQRGRLANDIAMTREQIASMGVERRNNLIRGGILAKDFNWYNWEHGIGIGKNVLTGIGAGVGAALGLSRIGAGGRAIMSGTRGTRLGTEIYESYPQYGL